jgi:DNA transposition AAA+ family ATPase
MNVLPLQPRLALGDRPSAGFAQLTNMGLGLRTYLDCAEARPGLPRIGTLHGPSGYGKSVAMAYTAQKTGALYVEAKSIWTQRSLLEAIAAELGIVAFERSAPRILQQIIDQLNADPRGLIIDEMDHLVRKQHVEIIRDIHDATSAPILLVGEEALPSKLRSWERFHNRILVFTAAQPASLDDALKLRAHYCPRIDIADDLVERIVRVCKGVTRRIVTNLIRAERCAIESGASEIDLGWWGDRPLDTGDAPIRRAA